MERHEKDIQKISGNSGQPGELYEHLSPAASKPDSSAGALWQKGPLLEEQGPIEEPELPNIRLDVGSTDAGWSGISGDEVFITYHTQHFDISEDDLDNSGGVEATEKDADPRSDWWTLEVPAAELLAAEPVASAQLGPPDEDDSEWKAPPGFWMTGKSDRSGKSPG